MLTEGPQAPTIGQYFRVRAPPFRWEVEEYTDWSLEKVLGLGFKQEFESN